MELKVELLDQYDLVVCQICLSLIQLKLLTEVLDQKVCFVSLCSQEQTSVLHELDLIWVCFEECMVQIVPLEVGHCRSDQVWIIEP